MKRGSNAMSAAEYGRTWSQSSNPSVDYSFDEPWMVRVDDTEMTVPEFNSYVRTGGYQQDMQDGVS